MARCFMNRWYPALFRETKFHEPEAVVPRHQATSKGRARKSLNQHLGRQSRQAGPHFWPAEEVPALMGEAEHRSEARDFATREVLIAGLHGPLGIWVQLPIRSPDEILAIFREQALARK